MKKDILLQHGWAYNRELWKNWSTFFPSSPFISDQGYFNEPKIFSCKNIKTIIAHSLGIHTIPLHLIENCSFLIVISGFQYFHPQNPNKASLSKHIIEKMIAKLKKEEEEIFHQFYCRANRPQKSEILLPSKDLNWTKLYKDLTLLNKNTLPLKAFEKIPKILFIHGEQDCIVPLERAIAFSSQLPNSKLFTIQDAGHSLPLTHANECWKEIITHWPEDPKTSFKLHVSKSFSKAAKNYDLHAHVQKQSACDLWSLLTDENKKNLPVGEILEIGCGTGFLTEDLIKQFANYPITISDLAPGMLQFCQKKLFHRLKNHKQKITFSILDGESIDKQSYSLIVSAMTFQWFKNFSISIKKLITSLKPGGILLFSFLEDKSFSQWKRVAQYCNLPFTRNPLPSLQQINEVIESFDFPIKIEEKTYSIAYNSPHNFFHELKMLGTHRCSSSTSLNMKEWRILLEQWKKQFHKIEASYNIVYVKLVKA